LARTFVSFTVAVALGFMCAGTGGPTDPGAGVSIVGGSLAPAVTIGF
jgi:hypothetical protein